MCVGWRNPTKEILHSHYDVKPYRDAFHGRNSPCYLLCSSFAMLLLLTILSGLLYSSSQSTDTGLSDNFVNELVGLFNVNRTRILSDTKKIYPSDLRLSISPNRITANKEFPICFAAPNFIMPILKTPSPHHLKKDETISNIDDIKKAHHQSIEHDDIFKKYTNNWLKAPSFFKDDQQHQNLEDDPLLNIRIEDMWEQIIGYRLDPNCFIRIDQSSTKILKQLQSANIDPAMQQNVICSNNANSVMKPSFIVVNPDNAMIYQLNINALYYGNGQCYSYKNTFNYDIMDKHKFDKLLSHENEELNSFFDDMSKYLIYVLLALIGIIASIYFGWMGFILFCMLSEGFVATFIVWIIVLFLKCCRVFKEFDNISPTFKEIWRINLLICVPDFTFIRIMQLSSIMFYWRICARIILTLLLIIDIYQNDPPKLHNQ